MDSPDVKAKAGAAAEALIEELQKVMKGSFTDARAYAASVAELGIRAQMYEPGSKERRILEREYLSNMKLLAAQKKLAISDGHWWFVQALFRVAIKAVLS